MRRIAACVILTSSLLACPPKPAEPTPADGGLPPHLAARVNGTPITHFEVVLRLRTLSTATPEEARDAVVLDELRAQRAVALGLDKDPAFLEELARIEAQAAEVKRRALAKLLLHREVLEKAAPSDAEVRAVFERQRHRYASRITVQQLGYRDRASVEAAQARLADGASFNALLSEAAGVDPDASEEFKVGPLRWDEVPTAWWRALDALKVGEVSGVIVAGKRFTLIRLLSREPAPEPTLEEVTPLIRAAIQAERTEALRVESDAALRGGASIQLGSLARPN